MFLYFGHSLVLVDLHLEVILVAIYFFLHCWKGELRNIFWYFTRFGFLLLIFLEHLWSQLIYFISFSKYIKFGSDPLYFGINLALYFHHFLPLLGLSSLFLFISGLFIKPVLDSLFVLEVFGQNGVACNYFNLFAHQLYTIFYESISRDLTLWRASQREGWIFGRGICWSAHSFPRAFRKGSTSPMSICTWPKSTLPPCRLVFGISGSNISGSGWHLWNFQSYLPSHFFSNPASGCPFWLDRHLRAKARSTWGSRSSRTCSTANVFPCSSYFCCECEYCCKF